MRLGNVPQAFPYQGSLASDYEHCWRAQQGRQREHYNFVRREFNSTHRAELLLFLLARCVKAAIRYNRRGDFNNSPDNRRNGMRPETMARNIHLVSETLGTQTRTASEDYKVVLEQAKPTDFVYMDPPYQGVCTDRDSRYVKGVDYDEFVTELDRLNARRIPFIVSYDGRTGDKEYGKRLPDSLGLVHAEVLAGKSTQATLLGRDHETYESLYVSSAAIRNLGSVPPELRSKRPTLTLFA